MSIPSMSSAKFRYANVRGSTQALVEKGRRDGLCELCLDILLFQVDGKRLPTKSKNRSHVKNSLCKPHLKQQTHLPDSLLGIEKDLAQQFGHHRHNTLITQEDLMVVGQRPPGLVRLVLSLELFETNDTGDEFDALFMQEIFILTLRVLGEETDRGCWGRGKRRVRKVTKRQTSRRKISIIQP
jgi:hypothetical protein